METLALKQIEPWPSKLALSGKTLPWGEGSGTWQCRADHAITAPAGSFSVHPMPHPSRAARSACMGEGMCEGSGFVA
eukprot:363062-Chlamydomonas_euryale.AAC.4